MTSPFLIPIQNYHSSGHCCDIELNIDFGYCLQIYDVIITLSIAHLQYDTANHQEEKPPNTKYHKDRLGKYNSVC